MLATSRLQHSGMTHCARGSLPNPVTLGSRQQDCTCSISRCSSKTPAFSHGCWLGGGRRFLTQVFHLPLSSIPLLQTCNYSLSLHSMCPAPRGNGELEAAKCWKEEKCQGCSRGASKELIPGVHAPGPPCSPSKSSPVASPLRASGEAGGLPLSPGGAFALAPARRWLSSAKDAAKLSVKLPRPSSTREP